MAHVSVMSGLQDPLDDALRRWLQLACQSTKHTSGLYQLRHMRLQFSQVWLQMFAHFVTFSLKSRCPFLRDNFTFVAECLYRVSEHLIRVINRLGRGYSFEALRVNSLCEGRVQADEQPVQVEAVHEATYDRRHDARSRAGRRDADGFRTCLSLTSPRRRRANGCQQYTSRKTVAWTYQLALLIREGEIRFI